MKNMNSDALENQLNFDDELLPAYSFNYQNAKPNRFASLGEAKRLNIVVLNEDVASDLPHLAAKI